MTNETTLMRKAVRYLPTAAALVGMTMTLGSMAFLFGTDYGRIAGVIGGMLMMLAAIWWAAHPFLKNQRRYLFLRAEVNKFHQVVSELNSGAVNGLPEKIERTRSAMHESIERMVAAAGKTE